jgi:15-cis-phytoene desaturase
MKRSATGAHVLVFGGGVAGLSAAHELAERGAHVTLVEAAAGVGGKARSVGKAGTGTDGRRDLPGEHGFRVFPGFYRHVIDTMDRIPTPIGPASSRLQSIDHLMQGREGSFERVLLRYPRSLTDIDTLGRLLFTYRTNLPAEDIRFFGRRMQVLATSCQERRYRDWEQTSWWEFIEAESRSEAYRTFLADGVCRMLVAMDARQGSARTIGYTLLQSFLDVVWPNRQRAVRILDAPTQEAWLDPWLTHLRNLGVQMRFGTRLEALQMRDGRVDAAVVHDGTSRTLRADAYVVALPVESAAPLLADGDPSFEGMSWLAEQSTSWMGGVQYYFREPPSAFPEGVYMYLD